LPFDTYQACVEAGCPLPLQLYVTLCAGTRRSGCRALEISGDLAIGAPDAGLAEQAKGQFAPFPPFPGAGAAVAEAKPGAAAAVVLHAGDVLAFGGALHRGVPDWYSQRLCGEDHTSRSRNTAGAVLFCYCVPAALAGTHLARAGGRPRRNPR
jgi:hypothetical protein